MLSSQEIQFRKPKGLSQFFLVTDIGFILYWGITSIKIIPDEFLFKDYSDPILSAWNWSFLPLDLFISFTGLTSLYLFNKRISAWKNFAILSLGFTIASGIQAISFWIIREDVSLLWWAPNLYLIFYPLFYVRFLLKN
ncbi:hypothetical protein LEP1GSC047_2605 [Leptospira inadai serovar Lyme str. 10]|uniref:YvaD family protein n=2 Tax=Leptospira inadai serovar Lyme TaxID=293084 RepID=V6HI40_9LEPT|nr:DUF5360 family protein [Leptospira inadai]EQA36265.1 hypothetical protein LEP1GSC047_2605 [Leptospira inadai serovar Lyme str. 10]PNV75765.1 hypothetical protein BES34_006965 [Leptospira inadai serovar Lyme]